MLEIDTTALVNDLLHACYIFWIGVSAAILIRRLIDK